MRRVWDMKDLMLVTCSRPFPFAQSGASVKSLITVKVLSKGSQSARLVRIGSSRSHWWCGESGLRRLNKVLNRHNVTTKARAATSSIGVDRPLAEIYLARERLKLEVQEFAPCNCRPSELSDVGTWSWEMELLQHVGMSEDPFSLAVALEHGIRAVSSDGSDWNQIQVMSTYLGERCACGMGPARSASPHAYRSESYGLLSLLCFLRRFAEFTGKHDQWVGIIATDSQSLAGRYGFEKRTSSYLRVHGPVPS